MKTYADECLERAEKATEGPWFEHYCHILSMKEYELDDDGFKEHFHLADTTASHGDTPDRHNDTIFIAHARTDVPELARRLKRACEELFNSCRCYANSIKCDACVLREELEKPMGEP